MSRVISFDFGPLPGRHQAHVGGLDSDMAIGGAALLW